MRRTLVIGGNLFIGHALVERLLDRGDEVTILHRSRANPFGDRVAEIQCDRNDIETVRQIACDTTFDVVFDNVYDWQRGTTGKQVRAAAEALGPGLTAYVFTSSCAAYGEGLDRVESDPLAGADHPDLYCRNKADSERALAALYAEAGVPTVSLRPPYVYGPRNPMYREAFFWDRLLRGRPIVVPGDGSRLMHLVAVTDLAQAALLVAESPDAAGRAYNVAHSGPIRQDDLVHALASVAGVEADVRYVPRPVIDRLGGQIFEEPFYFGQYFDMPPITLNVQQAERELGFVPTPLAEGLCLTFEAYRKGVRKDIDFSLDDRLLEQASKKPQ